MLQGLKCRKRRNFSSTISSKICWCKRYDKYHVCHPPPQLFFLLLLDILYESVTFSDCISCILFHIVPDIHVTLKASQMAQKMWLLPSAICKGLLYAKVAATFSFNEIPNWNGIGVAQKLLLLPPAICKGLLLVKVVTTSIQLLIMSSICAHSPLENVIWCQIVWRKSVGKLVKSSVMLCALIIKSMTQEEKFRNKQIWHRQGKWNRNYFSFSFSFLNEETFDACVGGTDPAWSKLIRLFRSGGHYHFILDLHWHVLKHTFV